MSFETPNIRGLKVLDEGITIANPAESMNFTGAGLVASAIGPNVTVDGSGGSSGTEVRNEAVSGTVDGVNVTFTIAHTPTAGTLQLYLNGARLKAGTDYSLVGTTITFTYAPPDPSIITADYLY